MFHRLPTQTLAVVLLLTMAGCRDRQITAYRAPKDPAPAAMPKAMGGMGSAGLPADHPPIGGAAAEGQPAAQPGPAAPPTRTAENALVWSAPAHWTAKPTGSIRKGSYSVKGDAGAEGDLSITAFPGDTGGLFANVNRWRGQIGLTPIAESELASAIEHLESNGLHMEFLILRGPTAGSPNSLLGAIVPYQRETWFFKLTAPDALITREEAAFREFLKTIKPAKP